MSEIVTVLVVDDSEDDRMFYRRCLQQGTAASYAVTETASGEDGLARLDESPFACVLLDYSLPGRNGVEILKRIRTRHPYVPVVMLTGLGNEKVAVAAMQEGAQNYISKSSITPQSLEHAVQVATQHCRMTHRIAEQQESLNIFAGALAHDLMEPVRTMRSLLGLVAGEPSLPGKAQEYVYAMENATKRMTALIDRVHFYTRLDGSEPIDRDFHDAGEILATAKENIGQLVGRRQAVVTYKALPRIFMNRQQAIQVFQNLLVNAISHCQTQPHVAFAAEEIADHWHFRISDNGPGVKEEDTEKLFRPFKRLSRYNVEGQGLGLAICKKIVELHGGKIWYEPRPGGGAIFNFTLPRDAPAAHSAVAPSASTAAMARGAGGRRQATLLLVDDNDIDIELAQILLLDKHKLRCNVLIAQDGREALARLRNTEVDLMLLDINMPRMDGFEVLEHMRAENILERVAVIVCSTSTYDQDMSRARTLGACGYLTKPPEFSQLKSIVEASTRLQISEEGEQLLLLRAA